MEKTWNESKKILKEELKKEFPHIKFSMKKRNYNTLTISYIDTDTSQEEVRNFVSKFEGKKFDGMIDLESYVNTGLAFGYIFIEREISIAKKLEVFTKKIANVTFDNVKIDMNFETFINLDFYSEEKYRNLRNWGHNAENMIYRMMVQY